MRCTTACACTPAPASVPTRECRDSVGATGSSWHGRAGLWQPGTRALFIILQRPPSFAAACCAGEKRTPTVPALSCTLESRARSAR
jgi:hypothetical protein